MTNHTQHGPQKSWQVETPSRVGKSRCYSGRCSPWVVALSAYRSELLAVLQKSLRYAKHFVKSIRIWSDCKSVVLSRVRSGFFGYMRDLRNKSTKVAAQQTRLPGWQPLQRPLSSWWMNQPICKNMRTVKMGSSSPIFGVKIKNSWNHRSPVVAFMANLHRVQHLLFCASKVQRNVILRVRDRQVLQRQPAGSTWGQDLRPSFRTTHQLHVAHDKSYPEWAAKKLTGGDTEQSW